MIKIPCLYQREFPKKGRPVLLRAVTFGCEWVLSGEGVATRKRDGTACMVKGGVLYKRLDVRTSRGAASRDADSCWEGAEDKDREEREDREET